ncbi:hypothetical protein [Qipengyuania thermophila]|uniref:hypothetical protein n=1 Tax=Qipengyuania thermophila TaxID=2509361 RepID=UPI0013EB75A7|nr:hypothetical protein [Qipengyuania thermophila]
MGWLWMLVTVLGVVLLGAAILYAFRANKSAPPRNVAVAEEGAREVRDELAEDQARRGE